MVRGSRAVSVCFNRATSYGSLANALLLLLRLPRLILAAIGPFRHRKTYTNAQGLDALSSCNVPKCTLKSPMSAIFSRKGEITADSS